MALEGTLTDHQRRLLRRLVRQLQSLEAEITDLTCEKSNCGPHSGRKDRPSD